VDEKTPLQVTLGPVRANSLVSLIVSHSGTFSVVGLILNLCGTVIAGRAIYAENRQHGGREIAPVKAAYEWVRVHVFRRPRRRTQVTSSRAVVGAAVRAKASGVVWPSPDAPAATQVEYLQRAVTDLHTLLAQERREIDEEARTVKAELSKRISATETGVERCEAKIRGLATESARWEVVGLFLVGLGSAASVLPAAFGG
jgi:hypothetical protein